MSPPTARGPAKLVKKTSPVWYGRPKSVCGGEQRTSALVSDGDDCGGMGRGEMEAKDESEDEEEETDRHREDSTMEILNSARKIFDRTDCELFVPFSDAKEALLTKSIPSAVPDPSPSSYSARPPPTQPSFLPVRATPTTVPRRFVEADVFGDAEVPLSSPMGYLPVSGTPRRRPMGPRAPSPWKDAPTRIPSLQRAVSPAPTVEPFLPPRAPSPAPSQSSAFSGKRAASPPHAYPIKKTARLSPPQAEAPAPLVLRKRIPSGGTIKKPSRRVVSGSSTIRPEPVQPMLVEPVGFSEERRAVRLFWFSSAGV